MHMLTTARSFAIAAHGDQKYGDQPYLHHLDAVVEILAPYGTEAQIIGYLHDVVEDTPITIAEIKAIFGEFVANCVAIVSDEPGSTRQARKAQTYAKMTQVTGKETLALVVKAADRLANIQACLSAEHASLLAIYKKEHAAFSKAVYRPGICEDIWARINQLITTS